MTRVFALSCRLMLLAAGGLMLLALVVAGLTYPALGCLMLIGLAMKLHRRWQGSGWAYGTAMLGNMLTLFRAGWLSNNSGLIIGRASFTTPPTRGQALRMLASPFIASTLAVRAVFAAFLRQGGNSLVRIHDYVHMAVFASTGSGKGVGIILPILLSYFGSCVCVDPKAENFRITGEFRRRKGHDVHILDPFGLAGVESDSLNPLDMIDDKAADFPEQVNALVDALIIVMGKEMNPHFPEAGKIFLSCIISYVCACEPNPAERNLHTACQILASPARVVAVAQAMQEVTTHGGFIATNGHKLTWFRDKELASVMTTVTRFTSWLDSAAMQAITRTSTFDPRTFKTGKATLYLILPTEYLDTLAPLNRMWISTLLRAMTRGVADERNKVLFLLDEAGNLGQMKCLETAVTLMRGYGIRLFFFFQSVGQVSQVFGDHASVFLDNIGTQLFFGVNAHESAKHISDRGGDATLLVETLNNSRSFSRPSGGFSKDQSGSVSSSRSLNLAEMARPLFQPAEVLRLSDEVGLLFHRNLPVIPIKLLKYYKEPEFRRGWCRAAGTGVGFPAVLLAAVTLCFSLMLLAVSTCLPAPPSVRHAYPPAPSFAASPLPRGNRGTVRQTRPANPFRQTLRPLPPRVRYFPPPYSSGPNGGLSKPLRPSGGGFIH
jgi:type IV secretion system protein VirD4